MHQYSYLPLTVIFCVLLTHYSVKLWASVILPFTGSVANILQIVNFESPVPSEEQFEGFCASCKIWHEWFLSFRMDTLTGGSWKLCWKILWYCEKFEQERKVPNFMENCRFFVSGIQTMKSALWRWNQKIGLALFMTVFLLIIYSCVRFSCMLTSEVHGCSSLFCSCVKQTNMLHVVTCWLRIELVDV